MDEKRHKLYLLLTVFAMAGLIGFFTESGSPILAVLALLAGCGIVYILRKRAASTLVDERSEQISGKAGYFAYRISALSFAIIGMVLFSARDIFPGYLMVGYTLAYTAMLMIILYAIAYWHYNKGPKA